MSKLKQNNFKLSEKTMEQLEELKELYGIESRTAILVMAIGRMHQQEIGGKKK